MKSLSWSQWISIIFTGLAAALPHLAPVAPTLATAATVAIGVAGATYQRVQPAPAQK